ncbi:MULTISPECIES: hypothetical protein [Paracoccus]|uniref:Uncharacterized protein n=1 Tax=Paracoccus pantotrophus TaxID=82367 RepID=A0A7H9BW13_PARPN|nr:MULTISPECIES: hypothetical protein [Paracoccus]MDF3856109.1 hypothetical protein [Paracoccus pantotrophus]MDQ7263673.1 hypothetical protein [Paracoccus sp. PS1]QLH15209.1 hypothetical protein HYQ43_13365 [Paracoccus pantotrophus]RNI16241.1 hypothetical protein EB844_15105 [Paracoccus pantotrophus]SFP00126.1 hypothetical protein SAMN04244567_03590 [Paracoccus pantotrophus]
MKTARPLAALAVALTLALGVSGIAAAQSHDHGGATIEITLNNGAKWRGDDNMIAGMTAIRSTIAENAEAIHSGALSANAAKEVAADVQKQLDFMIENCVLEPEVDEQFHAVLGEMMVGVSALEAGEVESGAVKIVEALNVYGEHFEHPGWQALH